MLGKFAWLIRVALMAGALGVSASSETCDKSRGETCEDSQGRSDLLACGSCYGAESAEIPCCQTCKDVQEAYRLKSWAWPGNGAVAQCRNGAAQTIQADPNLPCGAHRGCDSCLASNCAWCIGSRRCVEDKAWMCAGENDHIGNAGVVKSCPHRDEISKKREARRREELLAMEERQAASRLEKENLQEAKHRAEQRLAERQQSELERLRGQNVDEDKKEAVDEEEIKRRAANFGDGQKDPYGVLKLPKDSQMTDIRKAYRRLSLQFHPDKISDGRLKEAAQKAFMDVVAAYEILGDPDKRAAFDDLGGQDQAQFNTFWEWEMYGKKGSSNDFYNGETLISKLTESLWPRRVIGDAIWLVEFYAPWCTACGHFVSTYKNVAKALENDDIEVGAVNCVNEKGICGEWFSIGSYPSLMLIGSAERGTQQIYSQSQSKDPDSIISWARAVAKEWKWLYSQTDVPTFKTSSDFRDNVLGSLDLWFVVFTDGVFCGPCRTAITNLLRLGAGVAGLAKAAIVDCEADEMHGLCYDDIKLPPPPHSPEIRIFRKGPKDNTTAPNYYGECLFDAHDVQPHVALKLAELVARNALADEMPKEALFAAGGKGEYEDGDTRQGSGERPQPMWNGNSESDLPRGIAWGGQQQNRGGVHQQIGH